MNLDELTIGEAKQLASLLNNQSSTTSPFKIGGKYLFRTVTHIDTGEVVSIHGDLIVLKNAAWIADTGRYTDSLKDTSKFSEVEPYPNDCIINISALIDATEISELCLEQK